MRLRLIRHATLVIEYDGHKLLLDPMLDPLGARAPIQNSPNPRNNPLVALPVPAEELARDIAAVLVTHIHSDHWDATAENKLPRELPLLCQPEDEQKFRALEFNHARPISKSVTVKGTQISRTGGQHGTGEIAKMLAPVSGFVLQADGEPTLYVACDTVWCPEVENALGEYRPQVIVLNAGGARFLEGDPITMTAEDVVRVCQCSPESKVIAVHMEAINHCLITRADLRFQLDAARVIQQVAIPEDGDWIELRS